MAAQVATSECYANAVEQDSPLDVNENQHVDPGTNTALTNAVLQEVLKALKGQARGSGNMAVVLVLLQVTH